MIKMNTIKNTENMNICPGNNLGIDTISDLFFEQTKEMTFRTIQLERSMRLRQASFCV
jgi:hypothetical protein